MDKYIRILKKKLSRELPSGFDERFWDKVGRNRPNVFSWQWASLPLAVMLVATLVFFNTQKKEESFAINDQVVEMLEDETIFENLELLAEIELTANEWKEMLDEA